MNCVIALCGSSKSGKTTLAKRVAEELHCRVASFGAFVRKDASKKGLTNPTRRQLQDIGNQLATQDIQEFCKAVVDDAGFEPGLPLVIDGIRHIEAIAAIQKLIPGQVLKLVYVEADLPARAKRAGLTVEEMKSVASHPVESQSAKLRSMANLILDTSGSKETSLSEVSNWVLKVRDGEFARPSNPRLNRDDECALKHNARARPKVRRS